MYKFGFFCLRADIAGTLEKTFIKNITESHYP